MTPLNRKLCLVSALITVFVGVNGHSWLTCTDYTEKGGGTWKPEKCRGFPRGGHRKAHKDKVFGTDTGFDNIPSEQNACQTSRDDMREYSQDHPMAVYYPGQQVILVHPMKNHGADVGCTNVYIPDTGNWIYRSESSPNKDPSLSEFRRKLVFDLGRSPTGKDFNGDLSLSSVYPKPGYQNAPRFCDNTDKAMGTFVMNVPKDLRPGRYTFIWLWAFNSANNLYGSCFEVEIANNKRDRDWKLKRNGFTDTSEPCGGMTSNPNVKGNSNAGCTPTKDYSYVKMPISPVKVTTTPFSFWQQSSAKPTTSPLFFWQQSSTDNNWRIQTTTTQKPYPISTSTTYEYDYNRGDEGGQDYYGNSDQDEDSNTFYYGEQEEKSDVLSSVDSEIDLEVTLLQFTGEIQLPGPRSTAVRRYYTVDFGCDVEIASFWNCRITNENELSAENSHRRHYEVMQEGDGELQNLFIFFHVNHKEPCDIVRFPPYAKLIREEYTNM